MAPATMPARTASAIIPALIERRRAGALGQLQHSVHALGRLVAAAGSWAPSLTAWGGSPKWPHSPEGAILPIGGAVAQLGERLVRNEEVRGSTPLGSTSHPLFHVNPGLFGAACSRRSKPLGSVSFTSESKAMRALFLVIDLALELYIWIVIAMAIFSWLVAFNVVNTRNPVVHMIGDFLYRITEPALRPIRNMMPNLGGIDISPVILFLIIIFIRYVIALYILPNVY